MKADEALATRAGRPRRAARAVRSTPRSSGRRRSAPARSSPWASPSASSTTGFDLPLADALDLEAAGFAEVFETDDATTGIQSFLNDGPGKAKFSGR